MIAYPKLQKLQQRKRFNAHIESLQKQLQDNKKLSAKI